MISLCKKSKLQIHSILEIIVIKKNNKDENITKKKKKNNGFVPLLWLMRFNNRYFLPLVN